MLNAAVFLFVGMSIGYYMYPHSDVPEPKKLPGAAVSKVFNRESEPSVGATRIPSAQDLIKRNDPYREDKEETARTIRELQERDMKRSQDLLRKSRDIFR